MNKIINALTACIIVFFINFQVSEAQNSRFSQIYSAPVMLNPALAGRFNGNVRAGFLSSWQNSKLASISHQDVYVDLKLFNHQKSKNDTSGYNVLKEKQYFGININYYHYGSDITGLIENTFPFYTRFLNVTGAYHFNLTKDARYYAGAGFQFTNADATIDETEGSEYDTEISGGGFRYIKTSTGDYKGSKGYYDIAVGGYMGYQNEEQMLEMGFSLYHIKHPKNDLTDDPDTRLRSRFSAYSNVLFKVSPTKLLLFRNVYWDEGLYQKSKSYKDSAFILAFYSGLEVIKTNPTAKIYMNYGLMSRNFQSFIPYFHLFLGKNLYTRFSYEVPLNNSDHPANNAFRTEMFIGYQLGKTTSDITLKYRKNCMW